MAQGKLDDAEELLVTGAIAMSQEKEVSLRITCIFVLLINFMLYPSPDLDL